MTVEPAELTREAVAGQLRSLGLRPGGVAMVHSAFRAVRPVEGGPAGLIEALRAALGPGGTLVMPSYAADDDAPFDPATSPAAPDLGVVAEAFRRLPGTLRSGHPLACTAAGPHAAHIVADPLDLPPNGPGSAVARVHALDGQVLLLGVGHDANTMMHFAELLAGVPYRVPRHCTVLRDGRAVRIDYGENDHCCQRFAQMDDWLRVDGLQAEGLVGHAPARLACARDIVAAARAHLARDKLVFLHTAGEGCAECDAARGSVSETARASHDRARPK